MKKIRRQFGLLALGGAGYGAIELLWRGFTHWTMVLTGGFCFSILYNLCGAMERCRRWQKCLAGSAIITVVEFGVGCLVNLRLKWNVWDYTNVPGNLLGQICLPFRFVWFLLCAPATALCDKLRRREAHSVRALPEGSKARAA